SHISTMNSSHPPLWSLKSHRFRVCLTFMFAMYLMISNSSSLGMAIICMVNSTANNPARNEMSLMNISSDSSCVRSLEDSNSRPEYQGSLEWEAAKQSWLFSANYYGSFITAIVSGTLADRFGPKKLLIFTFSVSIILTFSAPFLAQFDYWAYFIARFIIGMGDGFVIPCINSLGGLWFPATEKTSMAALYTSGVQIAAGSSSLIGSRLCALEFMGGWPLIFYMCGTMGIVCLLSFVILVTDHPSDNKWLTKEELAFLESSHEESARKRKLSSIPWKSILTSPVVFACLFCNFSFAFTSSMNLNFLPTFFKEELSLPLSSNGLYTMIPFLSQIIFKNVFAYVADHQKKTGKMTATKAAKIFQALGSFGSALAYIALATLPTCDRPWIALISGFIFGISFSSGICGFFTCIMTIAPAYAGTITSIAMIFGQLGNALAPNVVSFVTLMEWPHKWMIILFFGALLQTLSGVVFMIAGSGEAAPWARNKASLAMQKTIMHKDAELEMKSLTKDHE
ncbi:hypothetical protein PFISCL1PPCAC_15329, partial [Pristionchus fissidentatus]